MRIVLIIIGTLGGLYALLQVIQLVLQHRRQCLVDLLRTGRVCWLLPEGISQAQPVDSFLKVPCS